MLFSGLVETSRQVTVTGKRLEKIRLIGDLLRLMTPDKVEIAVSWLSGFTRQGRKGLGYAVIRDSPAVPAEVASLDIEDVDRALAALAVVRGSGSDQARRAQLQALMARATAAEQQFIMDLLLGNLRQGALEGIMMEAVALASEVPVADMRRATMMAGNMSVVARALFERGASALAEYDVQVFRPVQPQLAQPAQDTGVALETMGVAAFECKLDGVRIQAHRRGDEVRIYTRALNEVTTAVPEIVQAVRALAVQEVILDGEAICFASDGSPQPFQVTMRRFGRRLDVELMREELPLTPVWFDILYCDEKSLIDRPQAERFGFLRRLAPAANLVANLVTGDRDRAAAFMRDSLAAGHEGLVAKDPQSVYAAGARGQSWLKIKKAHTLDLVILAAEWGSGRRRGFLSNLHLGARDAERGGFVMLGKTFKGLTDEMLRWQTEQLLAIETSRDSRTVYVEPKIVVEIAYSDLQASPRYPGGLALRFARVKRYRTDKTAADADVFETLRKLPAST